MPGVRVSPLGPRRRGWNIVCGDFFAKNDLPFIPPLRFRAKHRRFAAQNGLGEIVDNSVETGAAHIAVMATVEKVGKTGKKKATGQIIEISIADDGYGMNQDTLLLLLFACAKAESMFDNHEDLFGALRSQWGIVLTAALSEYNRDGQP